MQSFEEFWPFYLSQHRHPKTQIFHVLGTASALAVGLVAILTGKSSIFFLMPLAGYGFAWFSHFHYEKNKPATFRHPLWSLRADGKMIVLFLRGKLDAEIRRLALPSSRA